VIEGGPYRLDSPSEARRIVRENGWALLVADGTDGLEASHVPCLLDPRRDKGRDAPQLIIVGHIGRADPMRRAILSGAEALLVFSGPHGYVSPTWYGEGTYVPTWNYVTVHAHGSLEALEGEAGFEVLRRTVAHLEASLPEPWSFERSGAEPYARQIAGGALVFRMETTRITTRAKLSQDKPSRVRARVIAALERGAGAGPPLAAEMRRFLDGSETEPSTE
jgi:transcriptional regulator